jgi:hypothetical protein
MDKKEKQDENNYNTEILKDCKDILIAFNINYYNCIINYNLYNKSSIKTTVDHINNCINNKENTNSIYNFSRKYDIHPDKVNSYCNLYKDVMMYTKNK